MQTISLTSYLDENTQEAARVAMGLKTQAAVSQMLKSGRNIFLELDESGNVTGWHEIKRRSLAPVAVGE